MPTPRLHITRYHGVLAPRSRWRSQIVPRTTHASEAEAQDQAPLTAEPAQQTPAPSPQVSPPSGSFTPAPNPNSPGRRRYIPWAELIQRTFAVDVLHCDRCGGRMKLLALVKDPTNVHRFLAGLGLSTGPPPLPQALSRPQPPDLPFAFDEPA